jgi:hypothetical protein
MKRVGAEVALDAGLLFAGAGLGLVGSWFLTVAIAYKAAGLHMWSAPLAYGIVIFLIGALAYLWGKLVGSSTDKEVLPGVVNNYFYVSPSDVSPDTVATGLEGQSDSFNDPSFTKSGS